MDPFFFLSTLVRASDQVFDSDKQSHDQLFFFCSCFYLTKAHFNPIGILLRPRAPSPSLCRCVLSGSRSQSAVPAGHLPKSPSIVHVYKRKLYQQSVS